MALTELRNHILMVVEQAAVWCIGMAPNVYIT